MNLRRGILLVAAMSWMACPSNQNSDGGSNTDAGGQPNQDSGTPGDSGTPDAGPPPVTLTFGDGGTVPYDQWTWVNIPGAVCADGSPTGIGINAHEGATNLTVYFEGGGACWTTATCLGGAATNLTGYGASQFGSGPVSYGIFKRSEGANALANDNYIYVPYCTGDIHGGNNVASYGLPDGGSLSLHHVGFVNAAADLATIKANFPSPTRLVVAGSSAGGYGTLFNYEPYRAAFPNAPAFLLDDSGPALPDAGQEYAAQDAQWHDLANIPAGCTLCSATYPDGGAVPGGGLKNIYAYFGQDASFRGSLFETTNDNTISLFFNQGAPFFGDENNSGCVGAGNTIGSGPCDYSTALEAIYKTNIKTVTPGAMHAYILTSTGHTYLDATLTPEVYKFIGAELGLADAGTWNDVTPY